MPTPGGDEADASAPKADKPSLLKRNATATVASLLFALGLAWVMNAGGLPLLPPSEALAKVDHVYVVWFVLLMIVNMVTRFGRYHFLIAPLAKLSFRRLMSINAIGLGLITFLPLRIGEMARPAMLREKGRLSAWAVTGTVGAERILDGVVFSVMLLGGLAVAKPHEPLPTHVGELPVPASLVPQAGLLAGLVFGIAFIVMFGFYWQRALARRITLKLLGLVSEKLAVRVADIVERLSSGLGFLVNPRYTLPYLLVTVVSIAAQVWSLEVLAHAVGLPELTLAQATVVLGVLALGFVMPNAPGFFGTIQLALYAGLATYIAPVKVAHEGAVFVFLFYVTYLALVVGFAALALVVEYFAPAQASTSEESQAA